MFIPSTLPVTNRPSNSCNTYKPSVKFASVYTMAYKNSQRVSTERSTSRGILDQVLRLVVRNKIESDHETLPDGITVLTYSHNKPNPNTEFTTKIICPDLFDTYIDSNNAYTIEQWKMKKERSVPDIDTYRQISQELLAQQQDDATRLDSAKASSIEVKKVTSPTDGQELSYTLETPDTEQKLTIFENAHGN